jgi:hypothetical protein
MKTRSLKKGWRVFTCLGAIQLTGPSQVRGFSMAGRPAVAPCLADGPA